MATTSICFARAPVNLFEDSAIAFCKKMGYSERQVIIKKRIKPLKEATAEASNSSPNGCDECGCEGNGTALQSNGFLYFPYQLTGAKVCFSLTTREGSTILRRKVIN